mgnify:CR=1 FL=1
MGDGMSRAYKCQVEAEERAERAFGHLSEEELSERYAWGISLIRMLEAKEGELADLRRALCDEHDDIGVLWCKREREKRET